MHILHLHFNGFGFYNIGLHLCVSVGQILLIFITISIIRVLFVVGDFGE